MSDTLVVPHTVNTCITWPSVKCLRAALPRSWRLLRVVASMGFREQLDLVQVAAKKLDTLFASKKQEHRPPETALRCRPTATAATPGVPPQ